LHRRSYSIDAKSQPACDLRALYSHGGRAGVHRGKGDRLHLRSRAPKPRTAPWLQGVRIYETTSNQNDESVVFRTSK